MMLHRPQDPDTCDDEGKSALHISAEEGHLHCVELLLEAGALGLEFEKRTGGICMGQSRFLIGEIIEKNSESLILKVLKSTFTKPLVFFGGHVKIS